MKINCKFSCQVLATNINTTQDGKSYYNTTVFIPSTGEAGQLNITEKIFNDLVCGSSYTFNAEFNDKYKSFRVVDIDE